MKKYDSKRLPKLVPTKVKKKIRIQERDIAILKDIARYRFLTADQILRLHFPKGSDSYCNTRLMYLFHKPHRLLNREVLPVEYGKGSPKLVYSLTKKGSDFLKTHGFNTHMTDQKAHKQKLLKSEYRKHEIAINEFRISVEMAVKKQGWEIEQWISEVDFKDPAILHPMRVYYSERGINIPVAPDGFFSIYNPSSQRRALFFLEVDRGTMDHTRFRLKKIRGFHLFGEEWRGIETFRKYKDYPHTYRVLVVVDGGIKRTNELKRDAEIEFADEDNTTQNAERFYFTELNKVTPDTVLTEDIWLVPFKSTIPEMRFPLFLTK